jgi:hypothetical protein
MLRRKRNGQLRLRRPHQRVLARTFAVNILVRTFGDVNRIQSFGTDATFETGLVEGLNTEKTQLRRHNTCDEDSEREKRALEGLIPLQ